MARVCTICDHAQRSDIETLIRNGSPIRIIAQQLTISLGAINRHKASHMQGIPAAAKRIKPQLHSALKKAREHVSPPSDHANLSPENREGAQQLFLADFGEWGIIGHACKAAGISRMTLHQWKEHDEAFMLAYHQSEFQADDALRAEARRRGVVGNETYVVSQGKLVYVTNDEGQSVPLKEIKQSDTLLMFHMKARMPEYRDKVDIHASGTIQHDVTLPAEPEAAALARALLFRLGTGGSVGHASGSRASGE